MRSVGIDFIDGKVVMDDGVVSPIDRVLLDFDAEPPLDEVAEALNGLIEIGVIRLGGILLALAHVTGRQFDDRFHAARGKLRCQVSYAE